MKVSFSAKLVVWLTSNIVEYVVKIYNLYKTLFFHMKAMGQDDDVLLM